MILITFTRRSFLLMAANQMLDVWNLPDTFEMKIWVWFVVLQGEIL